MRHAVAFVLLSSLLNVALSHYVVFEDVGQLVTSLAYLHVTIPLNLPSIDDRIRKYERILLSAFDTASYSRQLHQSYYDQHYFDLKYIEIMKSAIADLKAAKHDFAKQPKRMRQRLENIRSVLPQSSRPSTDSSHTLSFSRHKRFAALPILLAKGIFGTFQGLYNRHQFKQLSKELKTSIQEQNRLLSVLVNRLSSPEEPSPGWDFMKNVSPFAPIRMIGKLREIESYLDDAISWALAAVEQAQNHRLSSHLFTGAQLQDLFHRIRTRTVELGAELLIDQPSDLFQIEVSYVFDGTDVTLIVHVPIATKSSILRLLKFHPFPLSFSDTHFLLPRNDHALFAISSDEPRLGLDLTETDLQGCYHMNGLYLCERLGVLSSQLNTHCLGALYTQRFQDAMSLCEMELVPISERVLQLRDHWFLVYTPTSFTSYVTCRNHTSNEHHLKVGVNKIPLSPSCSMKLQQHVLFADTALRTPSVMREFQWNLDDVKFSQDEVEEAAEVLTSLSEEGANRPTLAEIRLHSAQNKRSPRWTYFFVLVGVLTGLAAVIWVTCFIGAHKFWMVRKAIRIMAHHIWPHHPLSRTGDAIYDEIPRRDRSFPTPNIRARSRSDTSLSARTMTRSTSSTTRLREEPLIEMSNTPVTLQRSDAPPDADAERPPAALPANFPDAFRNKKIKL